MFPVYAKALLFQFLPAHLLQQLVNGALSLQEILPQLLRRLLIRKAFGHSLKSAFYILFLRIERVIQIEYDARCLSSLPGCPPALTGNTDTLVKAAVDRAVPYPLILITDLFS